MLLNGQAVAYMHMGKYEDAESFLQEALDKVSAAVILLVVSTPTWCTMSGMAF